MPISEQGPIPAPQPCPALPKSERAFSAGSQESCGSGGSVAIPRGPGPKVGSPPLQGTPQRTPPGVGYEKTFAPGRIGNGERPEPEPNRQIWDTSAGRNSPGQ